MKIIEYTISKHYLSALINGDYTGLELGDNVEFDSWLESVSDHAAHWDYDSETLANTWFTRCEVSGLYSDCATARQIYK